MNASIVDLRYRMRSILKALDRRERVTILWHGRPKGTIVPAHERSERSVKEHPFFGMRADSTESVDQIMERLRGRRHAL